jgi:hypothetical protein
MNRDFRAEAFCWWDDASDEQVAEVAARFDVPFAEVEDLMFSQLPIEIQAWLTIEASFDRLDN